VQLQFAARDPRKIQQVVNESSLELDVAADHLQAFIDLGRERGVVNHAAGPDQDGRKRCA
jgi:hypothetical protein